MKLHITDEFSPLKKVAVCKGTNIPIADSYMPVDPQEIRWGWNNWDKGLFLKQQDLFFQKLRDYKVEVIELTRHRKLPHQSYTRDIGFVIENNFYYSNVRTLAAREGEIASLLESVAIDNKQIHVLPGKIEGGDVLIDKNKVIVGISNRTNVAAIQALEHFCSIKTINLGDEIMHLDTVLTLLPNNYVLACLDLLRPQDRNYLKENFKVIEVSIEERKALGTNVFVVNPRVIFVEEKQKRIQEELIKAGFILEIIPYSEPIALGGSFRCTTLPLERE